MLATLLIEHDLRAHTRKQARRCIDNLTVYQHVGAVCKLDVHCFPSLHFLSDARDVLICANWFADCPCTCLDGPALNAVSKNQ